MAEFQLFPHLLIGIGHSQFGVLKMASYNRHRGLDSPESAVIRVFKFGGAKK